MSHQACDSTWDSAEFLSLSDLSISKWIVGIQGNPRSCDSDRWTCVWLKVTGNPTDGGLDKSGFIFPTEYKVHWKAVVGLDLVA